MFGRGRVAAEFPVRASLPLAVCSLRRRSTVTQRLVTEAQSEHPHHAESLTRIGLLTESQKSTRLYDGCEKGL